MTDESGKVTKTYEYDSFGNEVMPDGKDDNPFRYCGEYYDKETEEIYLRARYYQPAVGRFLTRDTYTGENDDPLSLHLYTYCENDGVNSIDPNGQSAVALWTSSAWWLCGLDGPLPIGDAIYAAGIVVTGVATAVTAEKVAKSVVVPAPAPAPRRVQRKKTLSKAQLRAQVNNNLIKFGKKLTFVQALATLGITSAANRITKTYNLSKAKFNKSVAKRQLSKRGAKDNLLGIYADKKYAAKALAFVLKADSRPEVHGRGYYGHYHDKNHLIHIWYGEPIIKQYDRLVRAAQ